MKGYKSIEKILRNAKKKKKKKKKTIVTGSCFITQLYSQHIENKSLNFLRFCVVKRCCLSFSNYKKLVFFTVIKRNYLLFSFKKIVFFFKQP